MCGRYTLSGSDPARLAERFATADAPAPATLGRCNVCPTEDVLAVAARDGERRALALRWGLVPAWAGRGGKVARPINARSESAHRSGLFAPLLARADRRCLVIADGWYEWLAAERPRAPRLPVRFTVDDGRPFAFAGLWQHSRVDGERVASVAILTTRANAACAPVHDRMPCVLADPAAEEAWLGAELEPADVRELLAPLAASRVSTARANPAVNKAGVEGPELLTAS